MTQKNNWTDFQMPSRLEAEKETLTDSYGKFYAQPFERGFGTTIGNSIRRALLSSIEGAAITAVKISGVEHEFSSIKGVVEDATDVILNLKQVPFELNGGSVKTLIIQKKGEGEVTSADIEADGDVKILDKTIHIATLGKGGNIEIEMRLKKGRGYISAEDNNDEDLSIGFIPVDSVHSPIRKVNFNVEKTRMGSNTEYDKLTIEVWSDGSVRPDDAIGHAAKLVKDHMSIFINFEEEEEDYRFEDMARQPLQKNDNLDREIEELELSVRAQNCLKNAEIRTIRDLVKKSEKDLLSTKNFGRTTLVEIMAILDDMGLELGMTFDEQGNPISGGDSE